MSKKFSVGDRVRINTPNPSGVEGERRGFIVAVDASKEWPYQVEYDDGTVNWCIGGVLEVIEDWRTA